MSLYGVRVDEWAEWTEDLNVGLISYYKMDDASGGAVDEVGGNNMGTTGTLGFGSTGKIIDAITWNANGEFLSDSDFTDEPVGASDRTINMWLKSSDHSAAGFYFSYGTAGGDNNIIGLILPSGVVRYGFTGSEIDSSTTVNEGDYFMVTLVQDSGTQRLYINGSADGTLTRTLTTQASTVYIGTNYVNPGSQDWRGEIDEVGIWNRTLTPAEINQLFNDNIGISHTIAFGPTIALNLPLNETTQNETLVDFNWTITPLGKNVTNWTLSVWYDNGTLAHEDVNTTINIDSPTDVIHDDVLLFDDIYIWNVETCDTGDNCGLSENRTFTIDTIPPVMNITAPIEGFIVTVPEQNITVNYTVFDEGSINNCWLNTSFNATQVNIDCIDSTVYTTYPITLPDNLTIFIFGNDSAGNIGVDNVTVFKDNTPPTINATSPVGVLDYNFIGNNETLNVTFTDPNIDICWYNYNGTNITIDGCQNGIKNSTQFILEVDNLNMTLYANDSVGNENSTFINWSYTYLENNRTHNNESFETATESFNINVEGPTSASLFYNGTEYTTIKSGNNFNRTIQIPVGQLGNNSIYWIFDGVQNSTTSYQNVSETVLILCDSTYKTLFLNISFKDEDDLEVINASIPTSTFVYYLGDGTITKTLTYINTSVNFNYEFCATPNETLTVNSLIQFKQGSLYPQRIFSQTGASLTNTTTDLILYLLSVSDGLFVTFQVFGQQSDTIEGVSVSGTRVLAGSDTLVAQGTTDAAGTVTFWLNPDFLHTLTYIKTGFETVIESIFPTQTLYTVNMGGSAAALSTDNSEGIVIRILPSGSFLDTNTFYTFSYIINSSVLTLEEYGFELFRNNGTSIHSATDTTSTGGTLDKSFNTSNESRISMNYFYITNGTTINGTTFWLVYDANDFSIYHFFTRVTTYITADIFGILGDDEGYFAKAMLSILILILVTGTISLRYGLASEAASTGLLFGVIFMLNMFDLIPTPDFLSFIELGNFLVFLVALYAIVTIIKEEGR